MRCILQRCSCYFSGDINLYDYEKKILDEFFKNRNKLIDELESGSLNKKEFIQENYMLIENLHMKPFQILNNIEKCLYNYQYYNVMAKYYRLKLEDSGRSKRNKRLDEQNKNKIKNYYIEKDKVILSLLEIIDKRSIISYPIELLSSNLNNLFEIVILDFERAVLHSINNDVKDLLISLEVYDEVPRKSIIDSYVNSGY